MLESVRSGQAHVTSQPAFFPLRDPGGMPSRSWECRAATVGRQVFVTTHGISGNVVANPIASSSAPHPQVINPWISDATEDTSLHVTSERQNPDTVLGPRCQSRPSARNSSTQVKEVF